MTDDAHYVYEKLVEEGLGATERLKLGQAMGSASHFCGERHSRRPGGSAGHAGGLRGGRRRDVAAHATGASARSTC